MAEAIAVTREEYRRMNRGGGGPSESVSDRFCKNWAKAIVRDRLDAFNGIADPSLAQFNESNILKIEFESVARSVWEAQQVIRKRSAVLNNFVVDTAQYIYHKLTV